MSRWSPQLPWVVFASVALSSCARSPLHDDASAPDASFVPCASPLLSCEAQGACVDPRLDPANCGACGHACGASEYCGGGVCTGFCGLGQLGCPGDGGMVCVAAMSDPENCGGCNKQCPSGASCDNGTCLCDGKPCCTAPLSACTIHGASQCIDLTTNAAHCGSCDHACGASEYCADGVCTGFCGLGQLGCPGDGGMVCVAAMSDPENCGGCNKQCPSGASCDSGTCLCDGKPCCTAPLTACTIHGASQCIDLTTNAAHCGSCDHACGASEYCGGGVCTGFCGLGQLGCPGDGGMVCVAAMSDPENCGGCNKQCPSGASCDSGTCLCDGKPCCTAPLTACTINGASQCIDLTTNAAHCGSCDHACGASETCMKGVCTPCALTRFIPPVTYATGQTGYYEGPKPLVADINQDGHLDIVVPNSNGSSLSIFTSDDKAQLTEHSRMDTVPRPVAVRVGDMFHKGGNDLVVLGSGGLAIHRGQAYSEIPDGFGQVTVNINEDWSQNRISGLELADLMGDGKLVAVVTTPWTDSMHPKPVGHVWVVRYDPSSYSFEQTVIYEGVISGRFQVIDLNRDGRLDIALLGHKVDALLNNGDGTFTFQGAWAGQTNTVAYRMLDVNNDNILDLVSTETVMPTGRETRDVGTYLRVALGTADGGFNLLPAASNVIPSCFLSSLEFADLNGDGFVDAIAREEMAPWDGAYTEFGSASGTFGTAIRSNVAADYAGFALADLDHDGHPDLIAIDSESESLTVHRGQSGGTFASYMLTLPPSLYGLKAAILKSTTPGPVRLATTHYRSNNNNGKFGVLSLSGTGEVTVEQEAPLSQFGLDLVLADVNGDGAPDALVTSGSDKYWLKNLGGNQFADPEIIPQGNGIVPRVVGDLNGDGRQEVVGVDYRGSFYVLAWSNGAWSATAYSIGTDQTTPPMAVGDINGDKIDDLIVATSSAELSVYLGSPTGLVLPPRVVPIDVPASHLEVVDVDGDGIKDVFIGGLWAGHTVLRGSKDASLAPMGAVTQPDGGAGSMLVDIDGDGLADLLTPRSVGLIEYWRGLGDGTFQLAETYRVPGASRVLGMADVTQSGVGDLLLMGGGEGSLMLLPGATRCQ